MSVRRARVAVKAASTNWVERFVLLTSGILLLAEGLRLLRP